MLHMSLREAWGEVAAARGLTLQVTGSSLHLPATLQTFCRVVYDGIDRGRRRVPQLRDSKGEDEQGAAGTDAAQNANLSAPHMSPPGSMPPSRRASMERQHFASKRQQAERLRPAPKGACLAASGCMDGRVQYVPSPFF